MVNKVILIGNLGTDPDTKFTPQGIPVAKFSLATREVWSDRGQKQEATTWHKVVVWNKLAENCAKYLSKGSQIYLEGKIVNGSYEKDGKTFYFSEVHAQQVQFINTRTTQQSQPNYRDRFEQPPTMSNLQEEISAPDIGDIPF